MKRSDRAMFVLLGVLVVFAASRAIARAWTCDDAFISYRYADNLVRGAGLVFNPGERVEGYTNFLFTMSIAGGLAIGAEPRALSIGVGILSYFGVAAILALWSWRRRTRPTPWIPLGAALWLVQDDLHTWASGGLETTMFAALALGGFACIATLEQPARRHLLGAGVLLALAALTRPDGVVFAIVALAFVVWRHRRDALAFAAPLVLIGGAYAAWKHAYYGRLLPTTFYAKSAGEGRWEQGLVYIGLYFAKHWSMTLAAVGLPVALFVRRGAAGASGGGARRDAWLALAAFGAFALWVARSSGDYMFARRLVPALPFLFVALDAALDVLVADLRAIPAIAAVVLGGALVPYPVLPEERGARVRGVGEERLFYPEHVIEMRKAQGTLAKEVFARHRFRASFGGGMCVFAYYSGLPDLVEPNGLTQYWIAEEGEDVLGRIGHKGVTREQLRAHGVRLVFHQDMPPLPLSERFDDLVVAGMMRVEILSYDDALMEALATDPRVRFKRIDAVLKEAEDDVKQMTCADARATHAALRGYYLADHPVPDARLGRVVDDVCRQRN